MIKVPLFEVFLSAIRWNRVIFIGSFLINWDVHVLPNVEIITRDIIPYTERMWQ